MGLSAGAIVAIVLSSIFVLALLGYSWRFYKKRSKRVKMEESYIVGQSRSKRKMSSSFAKYLRSYMPVEKQEEKTSSMPTMLYSDYSNLTQRDDAYSRDLPVLDQDIIDRDKVEADDTVPSFVKSMS